MLKIGEDFLTLLKSEVTGDLIKRVANTGLAIGAGQTYQIPNFPNINNIIYMELFLKSSGNSGAGSGNFIYPGSGYNYLVASSNLTGTYKGIYAQVNDNGLITVSDYRHGGVDVIGYRIVYIEA